MSAVAIDAAVLVAAASFAVAPAADPIVSVRLALIYR